MTMREKALELLIECRGLPIDSMERAWRRRAAWTYLQMHMRKPPSQWTDMPPPVTVYNA